MRLLRALLPVSLMLASLTALAPTASAVAGKYVAMGDSYATAPGTRTYDDPSEQDPCRRGPLVYSRLWANTHPGVAYVETACSGATTTTLRQSQIPAITPDTTLITVQVGGNDIGFVATLQQCILTIDDRDCVNAVEAAKAAAVNVLGPALAQTYAEIRAKAPNAQVVVVGYPRLYTISGNCGIFGLSDTERNALNSGADTLASVTAARAAAAGFTYLDARGVFQPHTLCSSGTKWVTSLEWSKLNESYHPNAAGHRDGYLPALTALTG